jgi:hypothetical protein
METGHGPHCPVDSPAKHGRATLAAWRKHITDPAICNLSGLPVLTRAVQLLSSFPRLTRYKVCLVPRAMIQLTTKGSGCHEIGGGFHIRKKDRLWAVLLCTLCTRCNTDVVLGAALDPDMHECSEGIAKSPVRLGPYIVLHRRVGFHTLRIRFHSQRVAPYPPNSLPAPLSTSGAASRFAAYANAICASQSRRSIVGLRQASHLGSPTAVLRWSNRPAE